MSDPTPTMINVVLTPEQVAEAFCALSESTRQAEFFAHVRRITERDYYWPERHWHYMCATMHGEDMAERLPDGMADEARSVLMEMTAPLYWHTLKAIEAAECRREDMPNLTEPAP